MNKYTQLRNTAWLSLKDNWGKCAITLICLIVLCAYPLLVSFGSLILQTGLFLLFGTITYFIMLPLLFSFNNVVLHITRGEQKNTLRDMYTSLKQNGFTYLFVSALLIPLWGIMFIPFVIVLWYLRLAAAGIGFLMYSSFSFADAIANIDLILPLAFHHPAQKVFWGIIIIPSFIIVACCVLVIYPLLIYCMTLFIKEDNPELNVFQCMRASRRMMRGHKWTLCKLAFTFIGWVFLCFVTCGIAALWVYPYIIATVVAFYEDIKPQEESVIENPTEQIIEE